MTDIFYSTALPVSQLTLLISYAIINVLAFLVMLWDKGRSQSGRGERISEGMLFFMAITFGALGVFLGMFAFRHKTRVWYFLLGIPLAFISNLALIDVLQGWLTDVVY